MVGAKWLLLATLVACFDRIYTAEVEEVLKNVPEKERYNFLKYYSAIGYELTRSGNNANGVKLEGRSSDLDSVSEFSVKVYKWLTERKSVPNRSARTYGRNYICFPNNQCIDVGDVGVHP